MRPALIAAGAAALAGCVAVERAAELAAIAASAQRLAYAKALRALDAALLASPSATRTLETWCRDHDLDPAGRITAEAVSGPSKPITIEQRRRLAIGPSEPVRYRRVRLNCGAVTLSNADNWYVPARLTPAMNAALDTTDAPFGKVVAPLGVRRRTVSAAILWHPARRPRLARPTESLTPPADILQHRADVLDRDGRPIAEVVETYTGAALGFVDRLSKRPRLAASP